MISAAGWARYRFLHVRPPPLARVFAFPVERPAAALSHPPHKYISPPPLFVFTLLSAAPAHIKTNYCINQRRKSRVLLHVKYMRWVGGGG